MIRAAIIGCGHTGKAAYEAILAAPDFTLAGIVKNSENSKVPKEMLGENVVTDICELEKAGKIDVALLCIATKDMPKYAAKYLAMGINTVDSYDVHNTIWDVKKELDICAKENNTVSILSSGWDPGSDSIVRALLEGMAPKGKTYTNFGPGMSMGHTVAVKAIDGVKNALSMTIPTGSGIHRRMVYIELKDGYDFDEVAANIKKDPYFIKDETYVIKEDDVDNIIDVGSGVLLTRKGVSGATHNQNFEFRMKIDNPALTGQVMVASARAAMKQSAGCYTMIEIPPVDLLYGELEDIVRRLV